MDSGSGLPSENVIARIPIGDIAGVASSRLATTVANPFQGNAQAQQEGLELFMQMNCASCHGYKGVGGMGPPLNDTEWRFGASPAEIYKSIFEGRSKGMPAWGNALPPSEIWKLVTYIESLGGTVPADYAQHSKQGDVSAEKAPGDTAHITDKTGKAAPEKKADK
jgi:cytochrome c oxidase cbb3-type subunit 3